MTHDPFTRATWEYVATDPRETAPAVSMPSDDRLAASRNLSALLPFIPADVADPSRPPRWVRELETAADAILRADAIARGVRYLPRPDVYDRTSGRWHVRPDAVAYRGAVRVRHRSPVRVFRRGERGADGVTRLRVIDVARSDDRIIRGWLGHERFAYVRPNVERAEQAAAKAARERAAIDATGTRGPAVPVWEIAPGTLRRRIANASPHVRARAEHIAAMVGAVDAIAIAEGGVIVARVVVVDGVVTHAGGSFDVQSFARRAALAGYVATGHGDSLRLTR